MENVDGLIISAGYSRRMNYFKPLMEYKGVPFLMSILLKMSRVCGEIIIITGFRAKELQKEIQRILSEKPTQEWLEKVSISQQMWNKNPEKIKYIFNPEFKNGMFSSLQTGIKYLKKTEWILYHFVDQPHIPLAFYHDFVQQIDAKTDWVQPNYDGKKGHPILFNQRAATHILQAEKHDNLKAVIQKVNIHKKFWDCPYPEILVDFNSKSDISKATVND